jgi:hypothetical protein
MKHVNRRMDERKLDEALLEQENVARLVASLPDEEPAPAWRSALSARLHEVARRKERKRVWAWVVRPTMGFAMGAALVLAILSNSQESLPGTAGVEAQILSAHNESVHLGQFWGAVRADDDTRAISAPRDQVQWEEWDLGTL